MEHVYGRTAPFALGMEEELFLVNAEGFRLDHVASEIVPRSQPPVGKILFDLYEAIVESTTPISRNALEGGESLATLRGALRDAGATLLGSGLHPDGAFGDVVHVPKPRYLQIAQTIRGMFMRTPTCAVHTHVGMPDPETAIICCNRMRVYLPVLQALAGHSPFWHGLDSGYATARAQLFRSYPRAIIPREFHDWSDFAQAAEEIVAAAEIEDYTFLWWDIRPHPNLGTVEVRSMDGQARLDSVVGLQALVHALMLACVNSTDQHQKLPSREVLEESSFRAGRDGLEATIWWGDRLTPVREVVDQVLTIARPYARDVGAQDALLEIERILAEGNGADRMRDAYRQGGMDALLAHLAAETAAPLGAVTTQRSASVPRLAAAAG